MLLHNTLNSTTAAPKIQTAADFLQFETPPFCLSCEDYENKLRRFLA